jgi:hypothetical protein
MGAAFEAPSTTMGFGVQDSRLAISAGREPLLETVGKTVSPEGSSRMVPFLLTCAAGVLLLAGSVALLIWLDRKYGLPEPPPLVEELSRSIRSGAVHLDLGGFTRAIERNGRAIFTRSYLTDDGDWRLAVETEDGVVIAFQAVHHNKKHWWLGRTIEGWHQRPRILTPGE